MNLSPQEIGTKTFSQVSVGGIDRVEVADFLGTVARQSQALQHELARAHEQIQRLSAEVEAVRAEGRGADQVAEIVAMTEDVVTRVKARAETEAAATRAEADTYARQVRGEVDGLRRQAEAEVEAFRQETVDHANRMRTEAEGALGRMRGEAEDAIRRVHAQVSAELAERAELLAATERALIDRLHGTAGDLHRAIDYLRERQAQAVPIPGAEPSPEGTPSVPLPDIDLTSNDLADLPPPPATSTVPVTSSTSYAVSGAANGDDPLH